jgi:hypothetical protein
MGTIQSGDVSARLVIFALFLSLVQLVAITPPMSITRPLLFVLICAVVIGFAVAQYAPEAAACIKMCTLPKTFTGPVVSNMCPQAVHFIYFCDLPDWYANMTLVGGQFTTLENCPNACIGPSQFVKADDQIL